VSISPDPGETPRSETNGAGAASIDDRPGLDRRQTTQQGEDQDRRTVRTPMAGDFIAGTVRLPRP